MVKGILRYLPLHLALYAFKHKACPLVVVLASLLYHRVGRLYVGMLPTRPLALTNEMAQISRTVNGNVLSLFRQITCPTSVSIHNKTLKVGKIYRYNDSGSRFLGDENSVCCGCGAENGTCEFRRFCSSL